jgi:hypothetical protein
MMSVIMNGKNGLLKDRIIMGNKEDNFGKG